MVNHVVCLPILSEPCYFPDCDFCSNNDIEFRISNDSKPNSVVVLEIDAVLDFCLPCDTQHGLSHLYLLDRAQTDRPLAI